MTTRKNLTNILSKFALAAVMVAAVGGMTGLATETANLSRGNALKLSAPLSDHGDPSIRDMPVVGR